MQYWNSLLTEKSWNILQKIKKEPIKFVVIGGWAIYLWTKAIKSKDIDIIITDFNDLNYLKQNYDLRKNDNLKKYEIKIEEIDIDIYLIHYSKLTLPIEDIKKYTTKIEGFNVIKPEILLILKQGAEFERKDSVKGKKDILDILLLIFDCNIDFNLYQKLLKEYKLNYLQRLKQIINNFKDIKYLNLNPREFKLRKKEILEKLR